MQVAAHSELSLEEASAHLGVPAAQLLRWACQGVGPEFIGHPLRPKRMLYPMRSLEAWQREKRAGQDHG